MARLLRPRVDNVLSDERVWREVPARGSVPFARHAHVSCVWGGSLFVFGGYAADPALHLNDLQQCRLPTGGGGGSGGGDAVWLDVETHVYSRMDSVYRRGGPPRRHSHAATLVGDCWYVYGGIGVRGALLSDLWCFDFAALAWRELPTSGAVPSGRWGHSFVHVADGGGGTPVLLAMFGFDEHGVVSDVHALDVATLTWSPVTCAGPRPPARQATVCVADEARAHVYVVAGCTTQKNIADTWSLEWRTRTWRQLPLLGETPALRGHTGFWHDGCVCVLGGKGARSGGRAMSGALYALDTTALHGQRQWRAVECAGVDAAPLVSFASAVVDRGDSVGSSASPTTVCVWGGYTSNGRNCNVLRLMPLADTAGGVAGGAAAGHGALALVDNAVHSDVTFTVDGQPLYAHRCVLLASRDRGGVAGYPGGIDATADTMGGTTVLPAAPSFFAALLGGSMRESATTECIELGGIGNVAGGDGAGSGGVTHRTLRLVMEYTYCGCFAAGPDRPPVRLAELEAVVRAADAFAMRGLLAYALRLLERVLGAERTAARVHAGCGGDRVDGAAPLPLAVVVLAEALNIVLDVPADEASDAAAMRLAPALADSGVHAI